MAAILLDHNLPRRLASLPEERGHAVIMAQDVHLDVATDGEILMFSGRGGLLLVTCDEDFVYLHATRREPHAGILRIPPVPSFPRQAAVSVAADLQSILASELPLGETLYRLTNAGTWERWDDEGTWRAVDI